MLPYKVWLYIHHRPTVFSAQTFQFHYGGRVFRRVLVLQFAAWNCSRATQECSSKWSQWNWLWEGWWNAPEEGGSEREKGKGLGTWLWIYRRKISGVSQLEPGWHHYPPAPARNSCASCESSHVSLLLSCEWNKENTFWWECKTNKALTLTACVWRHKQYSEKVMAYVSTNSSKIILTSGLSYAERLLLLQNTNKKLYYLTADHRVVPSVTTCF